NQCAICGVQKRHKVLDAHFQTTASRLTFAIVQCEHCGFVYLASVPISEMFDIIYPPQTYYAYESRDRSARSKLKTWAMSMASGNESQPDPFRLSGIKRFVARLVLSQLMTIVPPGTSGRLLDI